MWNAIRGDGYKANAPCEFLEEIMAPIMPIIKLHTSYKDQGAFINSLIIEHNNNNFHLQGGTKDSIHVFTEGVAMYVLTINKAFCKMSLNAYMAPEPDAINSVYLHSAEDIKEVLGAKWELLEPLSVVRRLIECLC